MGIEPTSSAWKADILADVLYPQLQNALYHNFAQMSSMNLGSATVKVVAFLIVGSSRLLLCLCKSQELRVSAVIVYFQHSTMVWAPITSPPEVAASFLYRNVLFAGELRAYDRVCIMCRAISAFSLSTNTSVTYLGFMPRVPILAWSNVLCRLTSLDLQ